MRDPNTILITGASSGIGAALARLYAGPGIRLALTGRDMARLEAVAQHCRDAGAETAVAAIDVTDRAMLERWLLDFDSRWPVELVIANAGISGGTGGKGMEPDAQARHIFATNVEGVMNTIHPLLPRMKARRRGQVAVVSSMTGFRGWPTAPAYSASKVAVRAYGESLRPALAADGIEVNVVMPGFVESRITAANRFRMPFLMPADRAAEIIRRGLAANKPRVAFPRRMYLGAWLLAAMPVGWADRIMMRLPAKE